MKFSNHVALAVVVVAVFFVVERFDRQRTVDQMGPSKIAVLATFRLPLVGTAKGAEVTLESLRGKRTFIEFWASWCESCRQERPLLDRLRAANPRASMLAVATLDDEPSVRKSEAANPHGYPVLLDAQGALAESVAIEAIPQSIVIDDQGRVLRHFRGPLKDLDLEAISKLLQ